MVDSLTFLGRRDSMLSVFGPLALLVLFISWASVLVVAFGLIHWALQTPIAADGESLNPFTYVYFSGTTFFTLGYGDLTPTNPLGRCLAVVECGLGFGFLAMVIGYLPVLTQAFSRREIVISLLDARGGSPPSAAQILTRSRGSQGEHVMNSNLEMWEVWSAELLESCLSFPMLAYYRSQHDNQSWLTALTAILDTCAMQICRKSDCDQHQVRLTFAIARHAAVDLTLIFKITPIALNSDRIGTESADQLKELLGAAEVSPEEWKQTEMKLTELRGMYEPFVNALGQYFLMRLPEFIPSRPTADNWQTSAWMPRTPGILNLPSNIRGDHFE